MVLRNCPWPRSFHSHLPIIMAIGCGTKKSTGMEAGAVADKLTLVRSTLRGHFISAGMGAFIYVLNALGGQVRIYLCGAEALVPQ